MADEIGDDDVDQEGSKEDDENDDAAEQCPTEPVGSLKKPKDKWLKQQGVDPHELKGKGGSKRDIYVDGDGNIWSLPKNNRSAAPQYEGNLDWYK